MGKAGEVVEQRPGMSHRRQELHGLQLHQILLPPSVSWTDGTVVQQQNGSQTSPQVDFGLVLTSPEFRRAVRAA